MLLPKQEQNEVDQAFIHRQHPAEPSVLPLSPLVLQLRPKLCADLAAPPSLCTAGSTAAVKLSPGEAVSVAEQMRENKQSPGLIKRCAACVRHVARPAPLC